MVQPLRPFIDSVRVAEGLEILPHAKAEVVLSARSVAAFTLDNAASNVVIPFSHSEDLPSTSGDRALQELEQPLQTLLVHSVTASTLCAQSGVVIGTQKSLPQVAWQTSIDSVHHFHRVVPLKPNLGLLRLHRMKQAEVLSHRKNQAVNRLEVDLLYRADLQAVDEEDPVLFQHRYGIFCRHRVVVEVVRC